MTEELITLRLIRAELPRSVPGMSTRDGDTFIVVVNAAADPDQQQAAFVHELLHIWHHDHDKTGDALDQLEAERHAETLRELRRQGEFNS